MPTRRRSSIPRDFQRKRVYRAEQVFLSGDWPVQRFASINEVEAFVRRVEASTFWGAHACLPAVTRPVTVRHLGRVRGRALTGRNAIHMAEWTWFDEYVLHELAHLAVGWEPVARGEEPMHGPSFVRTLHGLILEFMGLDAAKAFEEGCKREGVVGLPVYDRTETHEFTLAAGRAMDAAPGYRDSYRRYRLGQRSSAPKLRKGMTKAQAQAIRADVDSELSQRTTPHI